MKTACVIEGFSGGPMHTRNFRRALAKAGFRVISDKSKADIIIAHSAGIYAIPDDARAKFLLLIGPPYWPGKSLPGRALMHSRASSRYILNDFGWLKLLSMRILGIYYFFRRHSYMWLGIKHNNHLDKLNKVLDKAGRKVVIVRNNEDMFATPDIEQILKNPVVKFVALPGNHDDYYTNPQPYIDLLLKEI